MAHALCPVSGSLLARRRRSCARAHHSTVPRTRRVIDFSSGERSASITVTDLGTRLSQMIVAAGIKPGQAPATDQIVGGILRVCRSMKITCNQR
jgi:hypothetical protein